MMWDFCLPSASINEAGLTQLVQRQMPHWGVWIGWVALSWKLVHIFFFVVQTWKYRAIRKGGKKKKKRMLLWYFQILKAWPVFKWMQDNKPLQSWVEMGPNVKRLRNTELSPWFQPPPLLSPVASCCRDSQVALKFVSSLFTSVKVVCTELNSPSSLKHTKVKVAVIVHNSLFVSLFFNSGYYGYCFHSLQ